MKAIMLSIKPESCELIATGKKTIEVRKTRPKLETPFKCYIYETKKTKGVHGFTLLGRYRLCKVIGEFVCDRIEKFVVGSLACDDVEEKACLSYKEICDYFYGDNYDNTVKIGYAWHITDLVIYDKPKELGEFKRDCGQYGSDNPLCDDCKYYICCKGLDFDESDCAVNGYIPITRPPQSWCYVEEGEV